MRRCVGGGILTISFGATPSFVVEVPHTREGEVPGKQVIFGEAVAAAITTRSSAAEIDKVPRHGAGVRRAQLRR